MTSDPAGFAKYARDVRALGPWVPLLVVAILLLLIGVDITSGHAADPALLGQGFLGLFGVGLVATLVVRARRRPMGYICLGLALLEGAFLGVCCFLGSISSTFPMLFISGLTLGGLGTAGLWFLRAPAPSRPRASERTA